MLTELAGKDADPRRTTRIGYFLEQAERHIDLVDRRLLKGETMAPGEKGFSIFEPHTRWISKGKAGTPVDLGVPVCSLHPGKPHDALHSMTDSVPVCTAFGPGVC